ncbi:trimeric intracellular cation channel family protein [Streptomyces sp. NPDC002540]
MGGGLIRDVLLQHGTPVALTDYAYLQTAVAGAVVVFLIRISEESWGRLFTALDAAVIGFWAITRVNKTLAVGLGWLPAVLLGTVTAVGGGALRGVVLGRVPAVFGGNGLYATVAVAVAVAVAGVTVICVYLGVPGVGVGLGIALALAFRLTAVRFGWNLTNSLDRQPRSKTAATLRRRADPATSNGEEEQPHPRKEPS